MALLLFDLPPELLLQILATLPTTPLLRFAQTSQYARNLAYSNLHTLSLAIYPSCRSSWHNKIFATQHEPKHNPHAALIQIPQAWDFDYPTLLTFHNKIISSILSRHACTLQKLDLTLWTLSLPIATALATLPALRELSIRIESTQAVPRAYMALQRNEQCRAWDLLAAAPRFTWQLRTLGIENAEITANQLSALLSGAERLKVLRLDKCDMLTSSIWGSLSVNSVRQLSITDCVSVHVNEMAVEGISNMNRLQSLDLRGCTGLDGEVLEQWNRDVWHVPEFVAPRPRGILKEAVFIEVDPDYILGRED